MKCPICLVGVHESWKKMGDAIGADGSVCEMSKMKCPECSNDLILINGYKNDALFHYYAVPRRPTKEKIHGVPEKYASLYQEASDVLDVSPRASAALSRACLQMLLREYGNVEQGDLASEIEQVVESQSLPTDLAETIGTIRIRGNYAVHPDKSKEPGKIVDIEEGEAEWGLETLEDLFDHYITKPRERKERLKAFDAKYKQS